mmetsp:Transcript_8247/g.27751  ORF Transcript_8247/g.27751 Transcript_8247/m.27751 type:complete len:84 (+) Transcript_8247:704-955(+)
MASGILTGAIVLFLGLTNLITGNTRKLFSKTDTPLAVINKIIPNSVVRGLQLGLALKFFSSVRNVGGAMWLRDLRWSGVEAPS